MGISLRRLCFHLFFLLSLSTLTAQDNVIVWEKDTQLEWSDFQGKVDRTSEHHAATYSGVQYAFSYRRSSSLQLTFHAYAFFDRDLSWKKTDEVNTIILEHEQLHFDIAEIHARLFRKALSEYNFTNKFEKEIKRLYDKSNAARRAMQREYDKDSAHSMDREGQEEWEVRVARQLEALSAFSGQEVRVSR